MPNLSGTRRCFAGTAVTLHPDRVWSLWAQPGTSGDWDAGLASAHLTGPFEPGARGAITDLSGRRSGSTVRQMVPHGMCQVEVHLPGSGLLRTRTLLSEAPDDCARAGAQELEHRVAFVGLLGPVFATVLGDRLRRLLPDTLAALVCDAARG